MPTIHTEWIWNFGVLTRLMKTFFVCKILSQFQIWRKNTRSNELNPNTVICASSIERNIATFCRKGYNDTAQYRTETALLLASLECRYFMDCISFRRQHGSFGPFSFEIASNHSYQQMKKKKNENFSSMFWDEHKQNWMESIFELTLQRNKR